MISNLAPRIEARLLKHGINATRAQVQAVALFIGHLAKWNKTINLTSLNLESGLDDSLDRLVVEPFLAAAAIAGTRGWQIIDLGSGGGSPGIPLAIALETRNLTLVESKTRKASFLRDVLRDLGWGQAGVFQARADELWSDPAFHGTAEVISVRALAMAPDDWRGAARLLSDGGQVAWFHSAGQETGGDTSPLAIRKTVALTGPDSRLSLLVPSKS